MLTNDKTISEADYWNSLYRGERNNAKVDSSNGVRPASSFDRFDIVVKHAEGNKILGVGSGHARVEARLKAKYPNAEIIASDQSVGAMEASKYFPYIICSAYNLPYLDKWFDLLICTQALEYMEFQDKAMTEFKRVAKKFICTIPVGEMKLWSQLHIYNEKDFCSWLEKYGTVEVKENYGELLLVKIKFYDNS